MIMRISQVIIVVFGCFMGVMAIILLEINISLGCARARMLSHTCMTSLAMRNIMQAASSFTRSHHSMALRTSLTSTNPVRPFLRGLDRVVG
jgi:hypothetical protein